MSKQKWYKNPEMLIALTALFVGLLTAVISIYSAYTDRAFAKASVWPKVEIFRSHSDESFSYSVVNKGTGPAIIHYAKVSAKDKYLKRWADLPAFRRISQSHISTITLPSGSSVSPLKYQGESVADILAIDGDIGIELCYCSIYGDCWQVNRSNAATPINECTIEPEQAFAQ
jgi:hypothetical protein